MCDEQLCPELRKQLRMVPEHCALEVSALEDDARGLAAQLQGDLFQCSAGDPGHPAPSAGGACEADGIDAWVTDQGFAASAPSPVTRLSTPNGRPALSAAAIKA